MLRYGMKHGIIQMIVKKLSRPCVRCRNKIINPSRRQRICDNCNKSFSMNGMRKKTFKYSNILSK